MKKLKFTYTMQLLFDSPITNHRFTLKCIPQTDECQMIQNVNIYVYPNRFISWDMDSYGNECIYGYCEEEHHNFCIEVSGEAVTGICDRLSQRDSIKISFYKYDTPCTRAGEAILGLKRKADLKNCLTNKEKAYCLMDVLYHNFKYVPGVTQIGTTAEEAMKRGEGVCQDYAHILLSLLRSEHIPCRYIVGILVGEGVSHAWVEVYSDGFWYGIDPTNFQWTGENHIKFSNGRDYTDCQINQGLFTGNAKQIQNVRVHVEERKEQEAEKTEPEEGRTGEE